MVHTQTDPAGQFGATGTPSPSDCYPVGPVGSYVAGGPVGPDVYNTDPDSLTHMVRILPDPDGQDAAVGPDVYNTDPDSLTHMARIPPDPDGQYAAATGTPSHLTVTLLVLPARMLQGALLAQMIVYLLWNHASTWFQTMLTQSDSMTLIWILQNHYSMR